MQESKKWSLIFLLNRFILQVFHQFDCLESPYQNFLFNGWSFVIENSVCIHLFCSAFTMVFNSFLVLTSLQSSLPGNQRGCLCNCRLFYQTHCEPGPKCSLCCDIYYENIEGVVAKELLIIVESTYNIDEWPWISLSHENSWKIFIV